MWCFPPKIGVKQVLGRSKSHGLLATCLACPFLGAHVGLELTLNDGLLLSKSGCAVHGVRRALRSGQQLELLPLSLDALKFDFLPL